MAGSWGQVSSRPKLKSSVANSIIKLYKCVVLGNEPWVISMAGELRTHHEVISGFSSQIDHDCCSECWTTLIEFKSNHLYLPSVYRRNNYLYLMTPRLILLSSASLHVMTLWIGHRLRLYCDFTKAAMTSQWWFVIIWDSLCKLWGSYPCGSQQWSS